jgi:hypothetical protein
MFNETVSGRGLCYFYTLHKELQNTSSNKNKDLFQSEICFLMVTKPPIASLSIMLLQMYNNGDTEAKLHLFLNPVVDVGQR